MNRKERILVIEDDADFRDLLRIHLSLAGYALEVAEDGVAGGKALLDRPPDLVLSDVNMPFLGGFELLALMSSDERTASIPVILLSGQSDDHTESKALKLGAADFLTKPVTLEDLMGSIRACLAKTGGKLAAEA
jgi:two-component system alkaline phosphatase synthesis response regulator PhoP